MSTSQISNQPSSSSLNWSSLIQLVLSALTAVLLLVLAALIALTSAIQYFSRRAGSMDLTQAFMISASLAFVGILVIPSAWYAWKQLAFPGLEPAVRQEPRGFGLALTILVLVVVPGVLWLGTSVSQNDQLSWFLLPLLNIIANGLPALWLVYIGIRGLNPDSPKRQWGVFASGLVLSPAIILVMELLTLVGLGIFAIIMVALNPNITSQLNTLMIRLQNAATSPDAILRTLLPYLLYPGILFIAFAFISVIVPIIEEALKPIGIWFLVGQKLTPAQGFAYGVLCGAGFGLFENLGNTSGGAEAWAILVATRITTLLLHCLTTGLVGWALASAWSQKRYLRLGITYAFAILVHGLWNGMAVLSSISTLESQVNIEIPASLVQIGSFANIAIVALSAFNLVFYISFNAILRNNIKTLASLSNVDAETSNLTSNVSISTEKIEFSAPPSKPSSPPGLADTPPLPSSEMKPFTAIENPPNNPESNP